MRSLHLASCLLVFAAPALLAQTTATAKAPALKWAPAPAVFPKGAKMAVVSGDPSQAQPFEVQLSFPSGYRVPPHFHPTDETVMVKRGTLLVGMGDKVDLKQTQAMKVGASATVPAQQHHYAIARGKTRIDVKAMGPFAMTYVNPADDPQHGHTP
jgi:quercetin dioxygenase-like cupin family protein